MYSKFRMQSYGIETIEDNRKRFVAKLKDGDVFIVSYALEKDARSLLQNNYLWGAAYPCFVPDNFDNINDTHKHFGDKHLSRVNIVNPNDTKTIDRIKNQSREKDGFGIEPMPIYRGNEVVAVKLKIHWVKSTSILTKREFNEYKNNIQRDGSEMGIHVPDPNEIVTEK